MAEHRSRGFKAFMACVYAFPFSYLMAFVISHFNNFHGTSISHRIRSGLCRSSLTQEWASSLCYCGDNVIGSDLLLNYDGASVFYQQGDGPGAVFVKTVKTKNETYVSDMSNVPHAAHEVLRLCQLVEGKNVDSRLEGVAYLVDVCSLVKMQVGRHVVGGQVDDIWESVHVLLRTADTMRGTSLLSLVYQLVLTEDTGMGVQEEIIGMKRVRTLLQPFLKYLEHQRIDVKPTRGITSDEILKNPNPLGYVAESAFPQYLSSDIGIVGDSVRRIFTTFPEAASVLSYAVQHKIATYTYIHRHDVNDMLQLLGLFLANLQVMVSISFDSISSFSQIAIDNDVDKALDLPLEPYWEVFVTDENSRVYLMNVLKRASEANIHESFHATMEYNIIMATRVTAQLAGDHRTYDRTLLGRSQFIGNMAHHMLHLSKFMLTDTDHSGYITLYEFVKSVMGDEEEANVFREHMNRVTENYRELFLSYDFNFLNGRANILKHHHRVELEAIDQRYNEILDTFMIMDVDASGEISLEEFLDHSYITTSFAAVEMGE